MFTVSSRVTVRLETGHSSCATIIAAGNVTDCHCVIYLLVRSPGTWILIIMPMNRNLTFQLRLHAALLKPIRVGLPCYPGVGRRGAALSLRAACPLGSICANIYTVVGIWMISNGHYNLKNTLPITTIFSSVLWAWGPVGLGPMTKNCRCYDKNCLLKELFLLNLVQLWAQIQQK